jgi:hypothetical protein
LKTRENKGIWGQKEAMGVICPGEAWGRQGGRGRKLERKREIGAFTSRAPCVQAEDDGGRKELQSLRKAKKL